MANQTILTDKKYLWYDHAMIEARPYGSGGAWTNYGAVSGIGIEHVVNYVDVIADSVGIIDGLVTDEYANVAFVGKEIDFARMSLLRGGTGISGDATGLDNLLIIAASEVPDHEEIITFSAGGGMVQRIPHPNFPAGTPTILTLESVTSQTGGAGTVYTAEDDYLLSGPDSQGYSWITRNSAGDILATQAVYLKFHYTPPASVSISTGGGTEINAVELRITSTKANGKTLVTQLYKCQITTGYTLKFPAFKSGATLELPTSLKAILDTSRSAVNRDQLMIMTAQM